MILKYANLKWLLFAIYDKPLKRFITMTKVTLTLYKGDNKRLDIVRAGSWVTLSMNEAIEYAASADLLTPLHERTGEMWIMELEIAPEHFEIINGQGDHEHDGQHVKITIGMPVTLARQITESERYSF